METGVVARDRTSQRRGVSLAKGPVGLIGLLLLAYGLSAVIFGGHSFAAHPLSGTVNGKSWLGLEVNAWSSLLFVGAGAMLLLGSPLHWGAKTVAMLVGLALGAAAVIALYDKTDVLGIFAANGWTKLAWGASAVALMLVALLPRVGSKHDDDAGRDRRSAGSRRPAVDAPRSVPEAGARPQADEPVGAVKA
jgi:hypothetical protein